MSVRQRILFIDAYDSFAENIAAFLLTCLSTTITHIKIDTNIYERFGCNLEELILQHHAVVLGPGPGNPHCETDVGHHRDVWTLATLHRIPVLGICLGFQSLCLRFGLPVERMPLPCHGRVKEIMHGSEDIFRSCGVVKATNYNSLAVKLSRSTTGSDEISRPSSSATNSSFASDSSDGANRSLPMLTTTLESNYSLQALAWDSDGYMMAARHRFLPFWGLQFHPESCQSDESCQRIIQTWWGEVKKHIGRCERSEHRIKESDFLKTGLLQNQTSKPYPQLLHANKGKLQSDLRHVGYEASQVVQYVALPTRLTRDQVSTICFQMSRSEQIAMLESTKKGNFSIYAIPNKGSCTIDYCSGFCTIEPQGVRPLLSATNHQEMLQSLEALVRLRKTIGGHSRVPFWGGLLGYISYEVGLDLLEVDSSSTCKQERKVPEISMLWTERSIVYDQETSTIYVQSIAKDDADWVGSTVHRFASCNSETIDSQHRMLQKSVEKTLEMTEIKMPQRSQYTDQIQTCQEELRAGNSYELCLTTEAQIRTPKEKEALPSGSSDLPRNIYALYRNLHHYNPVPFGAFMQLKDITILSTSPEQYLSWSRHGTIDMVPMKGTVKRGPDMTLARATEILSSAKEHAENLMITDLIRHDLYSTVGWTSKVEVIKLCEIVEHETVYQLVSHIRAHAPIDVDPDTAKHQHCEQDQVIHYGHKALRQTIPAGSMTGAPKKRSCEILSRLENRNRGVYSGVLGFMDVGGGGSWSVCIRTAYSTRAEDTDTTRTWHVGAGGAITVLSDVEAEYEEMRVKLDSVLRGFRETPNTDL